MTNNERKIMTTLGVDGEAAFNRSMNQAYNAIKVLGSEMRLNTANFNANATSMEGMTKKGEILSKEITQQKTIVGALSKAVEDAAKAYGETDSRTDAYRIKLNNATAALNNMERQLKDNDTAIENFGKEEVTADGKTDRLGNSIKAAGEKTDKWKDQLRGLATQLSTAYDKTEKFAMVGIAAVGATAIATGAAIAKTVSSALENADTIQKAADIYGMSAVRVQELTYAGKKLDVELDTITGAQTKLTKAMAAANTGKNGPNAQAAAFKTLKVDVRDANGNLRDSKTVMAEAFTALGKVGNATERDALAMTIFGKTAMELNPLIKAGGAELNRLTTEAHKAGAVLSNETISALDTFGDNLDAMKLSLKGVAGVIAESMLPMMGEALDYIQSDFIPKISDYAKQIGDAMGQGTEETKAAINEVLSSVISDIDTTMGDILPKITQFLSDGMDILIAQAPSLLEMGATLLQNLFDGMQEIVPKLAEFAGQIAPLIIEAIVAWKVEIFDAGIEILTGVLEGIASDPEKITTTISTAITKMITTVTENLPSLLSSGLDILTAIINGIANNLPLLVEKVPEIVDNIVNTIKDHWPELVAAGKKIISKIWEGMISSQWAAEIANFLSSLFGDGSKVYYSNGGIYMSEEVNSFKPQHANGLDYVPYNNYLARLHEGEAVLTKQEGNQWRAGTGSQGGTVNNIHMEAHVHANDASYSEIIRRQDQSLNAMARQLAS